MARSIGIRVHRGGEQVEAHVFERDIIKIGRLASAHLRLEDPKVSRIHAVIDIAAGGNEVSIIDMGSAEGTKVNGEKVSRTRLKHGDEVGLGDSRLVVVLDEGEVRLMKEGAGKPLDVSEKRAAAPGPQAPPMAPPSDELPATVVAAAPVPPAAPPVAASRPQPAAPSVSRPQPVSPPVAAAAKKPAPPSGKMARPKLPPPVNTVLPPLPEDSITTENRFIEVSLLWGNDTVEVRRLRDELALKVGTAKTDDIFLPLEGTVAGSSFAVLTHAKGAGWTVHFTSRMGGTVERHGGSTSLVDSGAMPDGEGYALPLDDETRVTITVGHFSLVVRAVPKSRIVPVVPFFDALWANTALVTLFATAAVMAVTLLVPLNADGDDDDLFSNANKYQTLILKPPPKDNSFLQKMKGPKAQKQAAKNDKGKAGDKKAVPTATGRMAAKKQEKPTDEQVVTSKLQALFGDKGSAGIAQLFGNTAGGSELQAALGNIDGAKVAAGYGQGSLSTRGAGPGGGGTGTATMGIGKVGTRGRGSGDAAYGSSEGGLGNKTDHQISMTQGTPLIVGSLDKEIIRRIVQEHAAQIRYCYEHELTRSPGIYGKIVMKWVINGDGKVSQSQVAESQMKNANVESCLAQKIRTWVFPKPKGGGIVIVNYPFVFKQGG